MDVYGISDCFESPESKKRFRITFPPDNREYFNNHPIEVKAAVQYQMALMMEMPEIRIQDLTVCDLLLKIFLIFYPDHCVE